MKAVIFDFNGTLFDDTKKHVEVWIQFFRDKLGYEMSEDEFYKRIFGRDNTAIIREMFQIQDDEEIQLLSEEKEQIYRDVCRKSKIALVNGAEELFEILKRNNIPFTIATGSNLGNVNFYFEVFHLNQWFDFSKVVYDDGYLPGKPDPTVYLKACEKLETKPQDCIVFEDSLAGVKAAKRAGINEIYVISTNNQMDEEVSGVVKDYCEFLDLLKKKASF